MREEGYIDEAQQRQAAAARIRVRPYSVAVGRRQRLREGVRPPALPRRVRRRSAARLGGADARSCRRCRRPRNARSPTACGGSGARDLQAALVAIEPATGDVVAMVGGRDFLEQPLQSRRARASPARVDVQAVRLRRGARRAGGRRSRTCPACRRRQHPRRDGPGVEPAQRLHGRVDDLTLREALARVEQPRGRRAAAAGGHAARAAPGRRRGPGRSAGRARRWRSARAWSRRWNWRAAMPRSPTADGASNRAASCRWWTGTATWCSISASSACARCHPPWRSR